MRRCAGWAANQTRLAPRGGRAGPQPPRTTVPTAAARRPPQVREGSAVPWMAESKAREPGTASEACAEGVCAYVCGPPRMTDEICATLRRMGVGQVHAERWW